MKTNIKSMTDLRNDMVIVYSDLRLGKIGQNEAKTASNVAGKIIASIKTQIEYNKMVQSKSGIPFMEE